jgi:glycerate 2-kinase
MSSFETEFNRLINNVASDALKNTRKILLNGFLMGLHSVDPRFLIKNSISVKKIKDGTISLGYKYQMEINFKGSQQQIPLIIDLSKYNKALIIGGGKATAPMAVALTELIAPVMDFYGSINIPRGQNWGSKITCKTPRERDSSIFINYASHPLPDQAGIDGTRKMVDLVKSAYNDTIVFVLISGGGSALMPFPIDPISLQDLQSVNKILIKSSASINEINTIRKHISAFKGGNLARILYPKRVISLIVSDVIGDHLDVIASGPTVPDSSTFSDAWTIIQSYGLENSLPISAINVIKDGLRGVKSETPKKDDIIFKNINNIIIGSVADAKQALIHHLESNDIKDFRSITDKIGLPIMKGEAVKYGFQLAEILQSIDDLVHSDSLIKEILIKKYKEQTAQKCQKSISFYLINTGEFTVTIHGNGIGGRNQEMLLGCLLYLQKITLINIDFMAVSMAFDGIEGNSPATGALIDSESIKKLLKLDLDPKGFLENNDSYSCFKKIGDAMEIGQTMTNTNDMCCLIVTIKEKMFNDTN